jgi:hypothetical protein
MANPEIGDIVVNGVKINQKKLSIKQLVINEI